MKFCFNVFLNQGYGEVIVYKRNNLNDVLELCDLLNIFGDSYVKIVYIDYTISHDELSDLLNEWKCGKDISFVGSFE